MPAAGENAPATIPAGAGSYEDLVALLDEFVEWKDPSGTKPRQIIRDVAGQAIEPVPDYSDAAVEERRVQMRGFQARIKDMNVAAWDRARQIDYLVVRSRLDQQDFVLNRFRPWSRDPGFYADRMLRVTFTDLPVKGAEKEAFLARLRAMPVLVEQAQLHLDEVAADYADLAIHNLVQADGVGHGYPYRSKPPAGILGWYDDLLGRAAAQPEMLPDISAAHAAVAFFHQWLVAQRPDWAARAGVGKAAFDWYLKHVKLMPWTSDDLVLLGHRELDRLWADYALERHRNRDLPELAPAQSAGEYQARIDATDAHIRAFLAEQQIITVPSDIGELDTNAPWIVRPGGRNFWEEIQFRDPHPDHLHAVIPGHRFDHPAVRSKIYSAARVEGWATYLEEAMLQAGLFAELPAGAGTDPDLRHLPCCARPGRRVAADGGNGRAGSCRLLAGARALPRCERGPGRRRNISPAPARLRYRLYDRRAADAAPAGRRQTPARRWVRAAGLPRCGDGVGTAALVAAALGDDRPGRRGAGALAARPDASMTCLGLLGPIDYELSSVFSCF